MCGSCRDCGNFMERNDGRDFVLLASHTSLDKKTFYTAPNFSTDRLIAWAKQILGRYK